MAGSLPRMQFESMVYSNYFIDYKSWNVESPLYFQDQKITWNFKNCVLVGGINSMTTTQLSKDPEWYINLYCNAGFFLLLYMFRTYSTSRLRMNIAI